MNENLKQIIKSIDYNAIEESEKSYKLLFDAITDIKTKAVEIATIISELYEDKSSISDLDFEILIEIICDASFAAFLIENGLIDKVINLNKDSSYTIKKRIYLAIENYIIYWLDNIE